MFNSTTITYANNQSKNNYQQYHSLMFIIREPRIFLIELLVRHNELEPYSTT